MKLNFCLVLNQSLYCLHNSVWQRSSSHNYSYFMQRVFTQDWQNSNRISRVVFRHDCLNSNWTTVACSVLLMNAHAWECLREISINVSKLFIMYFVYVRPCRVAVACLFVYPLFLYCTLLLLVYFFISLFFFCTDVVAIFLFIRYVNKYTIFVFGAFVYHFKNTISIFVTI